MPEIINEKVNTDVKFKQSDNDSIASQVVSNFKSWDSSRSSQLEMIDTIECLLDDMDVIGTQTDRDSFYSEKKKTKDGEKNYILKDSSIKRIFNSSVASTYNSLFKNPSKLIDVSLLNPSTDAEKIEFAYQQKASLLQVLKKSKAKKALKKSIKNWYAKGELILYINWSRVYSLVRRKVGFKFDQLGIDLQKWEIQKMLKYDGASIKCIEPEHFVFDTSRADDFENAPKIHQSWQPYSKISNNQNYKNFLTKDALSNMQESQKESSEKQLSNDVKNLDGDVDSDAYKDGLIEVLTYEGDITTESNGKLTYYPNMKIVIVGRQYVACFQYNPSIISSYIYCPYTTDVDTGRGVALLAGIASNSIATTETLNKIDRALGLSINKCVFAPKGFFGEGEEIEVKEGGIIEYDDAMNEGLKIQPLDFQSALNIGMQFLQYLKGEGEEETGRFKYGSGDSPASARTLGEVKITMAGQNVIQSFEEDSLGDEVVIPLFEKLGEMQANFQDKPELVAYKNKEGKDVTAMMDEIVRQEQYAYTIIDTQTSTERKMNNMEYVSTVMEKIAPYAIQTGQGTISTPEMLNVLGASYDQEDPTKLLIEPEPPPMEEMNGLIPQEGSGINPNEQPLPNEGISGGAEPLL